MSYDPHPQRRPPLKPLYAALLGVGAIVALLVAGAAAQRYTTTESAAATLAPGRSAPKTPATPATPGVGAAVRDGKFEFVVSRVDCSHTTLGQKQFKRTAKGKFCVVS